MKLIDISSHLGREVDRLRFSEPVTHVYNPLRYAWSTHRQYIEKHSRPQVEVLLLGMNPGPFGMAQTGVPFGEVNIVKQWLGISGVIGHPPDEHPRRPIQGFACSRSEVSGARLWGWARDVFGRADRFFDRFFVANYCPLLFLEESGRNRTPNKLQAEERRALFEICDRALLRTVEALSPRWVVGIGAFAEKRAKKALGDTDLRIGRMLHPSPASPKANRGWAAQAEEELSALGIEVP
jgi:single-strand selective monofunctional uracil DNA glycosylase